MTRRIEMSDDSHELDFRLLADKHFPPDELNVEFIIHDERLREWGFPKYSTIGSAAMDLFACINQPITLNTDSLCIIDAGFSMHIKNKNYAAFIYPRSGFGIKGLIMGNSVGVIDSDYQGPIEIAALNRMSIIHTRIRISPEGNDIYSPSTYITINPGDRIAQMVFSRISLPNFTEVKEFSIMSERRIGRWGSTGT
jgi:dUTP pyrophosphatase